MFSLIRGFAVQPSDLPQTAAPAALPLAKLAKTLVMAGLTVAGPWLIVAANQGPEGWDMAMRAGLGIFGGLVFLAAPAGLIRLWRPGRADPFLWIASGWLLLLLLATLTADLLPLAESHDPAETILEPSLTPPDLLSSHPLGTDTAALDVLGQIIYGARVSILIALCGAGIGCLLGGTLGILAGYFRGKTEGVTTFAAEVLLSFPPLILLMAMVTIFEPSVLNLTLVLGVLVTPAFLRLARAQTIKIANRDYVIAAHTLGAKVPRILVGEILPNVLPSLLAYGFIVIGLLIVAEASLSYLGIGIPRPAPTWGNLISQGEPFIQTAPHLVLAPTVFLFLTVISANYLGQYLQKRCDL